MVIPSEILYKIADYLPLTSVSFTNLATAVGGFRDGYVITKIKSAFKYDQKHLKLYNLKRQLEATSDHALKKKVLLLEQAGASEEGVYTHLKIQKALKNGFGLGPQEMMDLIRRYDLDWNMSCFGGFEFTPLLYSFKHEDLNTVETILAQPILGLNVHQKNYFGNDAMTYLEDYFFLFPPAPNIHVPQLLRIWTLLVKHGVDSATFIAHIQHIARHSPNRSEVDLANFLFKHSCTFFQSDHSSPSSYSKE